MSPALFELNMIALKASNKLIDKKKMQKGWVSKRAVVLLSGGLDSATTLYVAKKQGYKVLALSFDYGQRHKRELNSARKIARLANVGLKVVKVALPWKGSSLLDSGLKIPSYSFISAGKTKIPSTYVPARNTIFLSFALSYAEAIKANAIFIGANVLDYSGYPDCRPKYFKAFSRLSKQATKCGTEHKEIKILTPLIDLTKADIVKLGMKLRVPFEHTWSCYEGKKKPCGICDSCCLRAKGFIEAGQKDPLI